MTALERRLAFGNRLDTVDPVLLGLDRQIQAKNGALAIPSERFWIHRDKLFSPYATTTDKESITITIARAGTLVNEKRG